jgi:hypothetical protein
MATMTKHKERSCVSFHSEETTKNWFFSKCNRYCGAVAEVKKKRKEKQNG